MEIKTEIALIERRLWRVEEYHDMIDAGILHEDDRVELVGGEIVAMSPVGVKHIACVNRINRLLTVLFDGRAIVSVQNPVKLDDKSEPEPDVVLFRYQDDFYEKNAGTAEDVLLVIEVSDSTLAYDRRVKVPLYAKAGIPEYWLVNLIDNTIEVHRQAEGNNYAEQFRLYQKDEISAVAFPETTFLVSEIFL